MAGRRRRPSSGAARAGRGLSDALYPTLDLHGLTSTEARGRAERWLREQQSAGERTVRLITGRGLHSVGPPVLPVEIGEVLTSLKGTLVAKFETEPGGGVFRVELRRAPAAPEPALSMKRPSPPPAPALRREAEEALAELGIQPTPELVEAEMRRLAEEKAKR